MLKLFPHVFHLYSTCLACLACACCYRHGQLFRVGGVNFFLSCCIPFGPLDSCDCRYCAEKCPLGNAAAIFNFNYDGARLFETMFPPLHLCCCTLVLGWAGYLLASSPFHLMSCSQLQESIQYCLYFAFLLLHFCVVSGMDGNAFFGGHAAKLIEIKPAGIKDRSTMEASPAITANSHLAGSEPGRRAAVVCTPGNSCICICMHVYACIFMDACKPACLPVCLPVCLSGCMDVWMYGCSMMDEWMDRWICVWATRAAFSCAQGQAAPCFHSML